MAKKKITIVMDTPKTKDLEPPQLKAEVELELDADADHERVKWAYIEKNFEKGFKKILEAQVKNLATPLKSMQADIDKMRAAFDKLTGETNIGKLTKQMDEAIEHHKQLMEAKKEYAQHLADCVKNIEDQQSLIYKDKLLKEAETAAMKKIKKDITWKKVRMITKVVVVGVLVVGSAAAAIAASIVTFGTLPAAIAILGVVVGGITGVSALTKTAASIANVTNLEKKSIAKILADLEEISVHLGKVESKVKGLPKHLDDASRFHSLRQADIKKTNSEFDELGSKIKELETKMASIPDELKELKKKQKQLKELKDKREKASKAIRDAMKNDEALNKAMEEARQLVGDLSKLPFTGPRGVITRVKANANLDGALSAVDLITGTVGNCNTLAGGLV